MLKANPKDELQLSQYRLRQGIGWVGAFIPISMLVSVLLFGAQMKGSISAWYYQPVFSTFFVGPLWAVGVYLFLYQGYATLPKPIEAAGLLRPFHRFLNDAALTSVAGAAAIVVATVPTLAPEVAAGHCTNPDDFAMRWPQVVHIGAAFTFFAVTGLMSLIYFTDSDKDRNRWSVEKRRANLIFTICGWVIFAGLGLMAAAVLLGWDCSNRPIPYPVFWFETACVIAFAVSWLVKGEVVLKRHVG